MARILIVEDEEKIARFVTLELEHEGYQVEHAADGRTAVDLALERNYDLILLDVLLPQLNGMEVLRRVRKHKDVPVIMVTARDAVMDKVAGLDAGADDYLTKPFAIEELFARIRVALKRSEAARAASGVGVGGAGVEALGVDNLAVGLLGGLVQGGVGHIVAVGSNDGQGLLVRGQAQLLRHVGSYVGDNASRQYMCGQRIAFHIDFPPCSYSFRSVPLAFLSSMILMISAMWAPASEIIKIM
ncbi:MAG: DNA-binding response regulator, partial [Collinsella aerofaciens]|nr:DNA-binding response regulator [Collinsella aerofaciens]